MTLLHRLAMFIGGLLAPSIAMSVCIVEDFGKQVSESSFIGLAVVTASAIDDPAQLAHAKAFRMSHQLQMLQVLKQEPGATAPVSAYSFDRFHAPHARDFDDNERLEVLPGDVVAVLSRGERSIELTTCSRSRVVRQNPRIVKKLQRAMAASE